jgi:hypothetical protein
MTNWTSSHSSTASDLYKLILETLNLVEVMLKQKDKANKEKGTNQRANKFSCIDVPIDINGRHTICDRARKIPSKVNAKQKELRSNSRKG